MQYPAPWLRTASAQIFTQQPLRPQIPLQTIPAQASRRPRLL
jgi:hypothetical protein